MGEDGHCTSKLALAVTDGLGGTKFTSYYWANYIAQAYVRSMYMYSLESKEKSDDDIKKLVNEEMGNYAKRYLANMKSVMDSKFFHFFDDPKATLIGCVIDNRENVLRMMRVGDSLLVVFVPTESKLGYSAFYPIFMSQPEQSDFNAPHHFTLTERKGEQKVFKLSIQKYMLVILGSDGLFDNIHLSRLTLLVNFIAQKLIQNDLKTIDEEIIIQANEYIKFFVDYEELNIKKKEKSKSSKIELEKEIENGKKSVPFNEEKSEMAKDFQIKDKIECTHDDYLYKPENFENSKIFLSECINNKIDDEFKFSSDDLIQIEKNFNMKKFAKNILRFVKILSNSQTTYPSPFYLESKKFKKHFSIRGKPDDITIIASMIKEDPNPSVLTKKKLEKHLRLDNYRIYCLEHAIKFDFVFYSNDEMKNKRYKERDLENNLVENEYYLRNMI